MTLTIEPNQMIALTGEPGCGKSTLLNLMMRFYDPNFGEILLDGKNIKNYNFNDLRKRVSAAMQEPFIFDEISAGENILYSKAE